MAVVFRSSRLTAHTWDAPCVGSLSPAYSCAPATGEPIIRTAPAHPDHRSEAYLNTPSRSRMGSYSSKRARCPRRVVPRGSKGRGRHALDRKGRRLVRSTASTPHAGPGDDEAPGTEGNG